MSAGCANCGGNCCRKYRVPVTVRDVRTLVEATGLEPKDFVWLVRGDGDGFRLKRGGPAMEIHLQRRQETGGCVLLMEIAPGNARCGVYDHRPLVCSTFPASLKQGVVAIRQDTVCGPDAWNLTELDLPRYRRELGTDHAARIEDRRIMESWNKVVDASDREATQDELFEYVLNHRAETEG